MKKTALISVLFFLIILEGMGQTKKIFHKSHSGLPGTMELDEKNTFGPGMAPVRYSTPESRIKLNYLEVDQSGYLFPKVQLDTAKKVMRFFDTRDSLIGCERNYEEYLSHGSLVFDVVTQEFWVYQNYAQRASGKQVSSQLFILISDSVSKWLDTRGWIRNSRSFIRDGNNHRILMTYPTLNYTVTSKLKPELVNPRISYPIVKGNEVLKEEKKERKKTKQKTIEPNIRTEENKEDMVGFSGNENTPPTSRWLIWMGIFFFGFSAFMFLGIKQIVREEITKSNLNK